MMDYKINSNQTRYLPRRLIKATLVLSGFESAFSPLKKKVWDKGSKSEQEDLSLIELIIGC